MNTFKKQMVVALMVGAGCLAMAPAHADDWGIGKWLAELRAGAQQGREQMPNLDNLTKNPPKVESLPKQEKMPPVSPELLRFSNDYKNMPKAQPLPKQEKMAPVNTDVKGWLPGKAGETRELTGAQIRN